MNRSCREVRALLGRPREATSEAERLVVEQHLVECAECRKAGDLAGVVRDAVLDAPSGLSDSARERVLERALGTLERPRVARGPTRRASAWWVAAAACVLLGTWWATREQEVARAPVARPQPPAVVASAAPTAPVSAEPSAPEPVPAVAPVRDPSWHHAEHDEVLNFEHARVEVEHDSELRFGKIKHTLELQQGRVVVVVDPKPKKPFYVRTSNFRVQVLGTEFTVTPDHVEVDHGHVVVRNLSGLQIADLHDGQSMNWLHCLPPREHRRALMPPLEAAGKLLAQAREVLAQGQVETARSLVARARELALARDDMAEAGSLMAECALVGGDTERALSVYERTAKRYADLPAGENALFAAAQLTARVRDAASAERAYARYLARYPHGRFADEARARSR